MTVLTSPPPVDPVTGEADLSSGLHELAGQDAWTDLGYDGIVGDYTHAAWKVVPNTGTTLRVGVVDDVLGLLGYRARIASTEAPNVGTVGTQPVSGQQRLSRVVARLDRSTYVTRVVVIPGAPALSAVAPPVRNDGTFWDLPLARVLQRGTAAITASDITDERSWTGDHKELAPGASLFGPIGCTRGREGVLWRRVPGATPTWVDVTASVEARLTAALVNRPRLFAGVAGGATTSAGDLIVQRAFGGVPVITYVLKGNVPTPVEQYLTTVTQNGFTVRFVRRDNGLPLANNPMTISYHAVLP